MTRGGMKEYLEAIRIRYIHGDRKEKSRILDEAERVTNLHRKALIRALRAQPRGTPRGKVGRPRRYSLEAAAALKTLWEASDRVCAKRLQPFIPELMEVLERHGELVLETEIKEQLCAMSAATIDRLLRPHRQGSLRRPFSTTKPGTLLKAAIPIRTFAEWNEDRPGFLEIDLVAHCGETTEGQYLNTLCAVDIATGWVSCRAVLGKGQQRVGGAIHHIGQNLPFPLLGLDSDNGSEFINHHLFAYCQQKSITFTRSRPYKKNDNAHVEQKNWSVVRRLVGYDRYQSQKALAQLNRFYVLVERYVNFFQPVMQLQEKHRQGAQVRKVYDSPRTPYRRLLEQNVLSQERRHHLEQQYRQLNPVKLLGDINKELDRLWQLPVTHTQYLPPHQ